MNQINRQRSLFWPILLIGIGVIWLLGNLQIVPMANPVILMRFWPVVLVFLGLNLLVGKTSTLASIIIGFLAVGVLLAFLIASQTVNVQSSTHPTIEMINEPIGQAQKAEIHLNLSSYPVNISTVKDPNQLFEGEIGAYGKINFSVSGDQTRRIFLDHSGSPDFWFNMPLTRLPLKWDIGLNPSVPMGLSIDGGSGSVDIDLSSMNLTSTYIDVGSGSIDLTLPSSQKGYTAELMGGSGSLRVRITDAYNLNLDLDGGIGSTKVDLPANSAVRVEVLDRGSGSLSLPNRLVPILNGYEHDEGIWQTENYDGEKYKILIRILDAGSGSITFR